MLRTHQRILLLWGHTSPCWAIFAKLQETDYILWSEHSYSSQDASVKWHIHVAGKSHCTNIKSAKFIPLRNFEPGETSSARFRKIVRCERATICPRHNMRSNEGWTLIRSFQLPRAVVCT